MKNEAIFTEKNIGRRFVAFCFSYVLASVACQETHGRDIVERINNTKII